MEKVESPVAMIVATTEVGDEHKRVLVRRGRCLGGLPHRGGSLASENVSKAAVAVVGNRPTKWLSQWQMRQCQ